MVELLGFLDLEMLALHWSVINLGDYYIGECEWLCGKKRGKLIGIWVIVEKCHKNDDFLIFFRSFSI